jgi:hypothetical protein
MRYLSTKEMSLRVGYLIKFAHYYFLEERSSRFAVLVYSLLQGEMVLIRARSVSSHAKNIDKAPLSA